MLRATGAVMLAYAALMAAMGWLQAEVAWIVSGGLLLVGGLAMLVRRPHSRLVVFSASVSAAGVGAVGQTQAALASGASLTTATMAWLLWSALWLTCAWVGAHYLPSPPRPERAPAA